MKILIAEDDPTFRRMLAAMLKQLDFEPVPAKDGNEAWGLLSGGSPPPMALLDWMMPAIDGVELCRRVREQKREPYTYLILVTGKRDTADIVTAMEAGADDYVTKPPDIEELKVRIKAGRRIVELQNQLLEARESVARHCADLEAINSSLEGFSYVVTNNILQSLQSIASSAKLIEDVPCRSDEQFKGHTRRIYQKTKELGNTITRLREFLRPARTELEHLPVDLSVLARGIADRLTEADPDRRVTFRIADGIVGEGDEKLLKLVLEKLLGNAWTHTREREQAVVEFGATRIPGTITCFVRDNGIGFDQDHAEKMFLPFFHIPGTDDLATGVGLATIQRIIHRHGGRIWAEGETGKGATFYFTLTPPIA